jgi:hypothetical protein
MALTCLTCLRGHSLAQVVFLYGETHVVIDTSLIIFARFCFGQVSLRRLGSVLERRVSRLFRPEWRFFGFLQSSVYVSDAVTALDYMNCRFKVPFLSLQPVLYTSMSSSVLRPHVEGHQTKNSVCSAENGMSRVFDLIRLRVSHVE